MKQLSVQQAREQLYELINEVTQQHQLIYISGDDKNNDVVLLAKKDWEAIQETLYLNQIPGMVESIHEASQEAIDECISVEDLEW
ncbi:type II toxin-antitoxin system Phd/YefM family antitoxin [Dactylococcopsis salina]|uniref:Antitoxin n=1 Tax=Dactylococcopsis salina (strain PCC 8305) TaxID=13035 RepID=K9YT90_DACS8|nr:type II toxin-antitoxin system Phd/YefM family antitoxin [Dactylococcopsis salina]AFZ49580.1 prevent-host-death family protein [Dactylococcopsis salina PCC 8305]